MHRRTTRRTARAEALAFAALFTVVATTAASGQESVQLKNAAVALQKGLLDQAVQFYTDAWPTRGCRTISAPSS